MSDRMVGSIKGGIAGWIRGVLYCAELGGGASVVVASGLFGWALAWSTGQCVGDATTLVGAAMGSGRGFISKGCAHGQ